jgi:hypothetical protein
MKKPNESNSEEAPKGSHANDEEQIARIIENDPLISSRGSGKELWADEHADEYVRRLREGWD